MNERQNTKTCRSEYTALIQMHRRERSLLLQVDWRQVVGLVHLLQSDVQLWAQDWSAGLLRRGQDLLSFLRHSVQVLLNSVQLHLHFLFEPETKTQWIFRLNMTKNTGHVIFHIIIKRKKSMYIQGTVN